MLTLGLVIAAALLVGSGVHGQERPRSDPARTAGIDRRSNIRETRALLRDILSQASAIADSNPDATERWDVHLKVFKLRWRTGDTAGSRESVRSALSATNLREAAGDRVYGIYTLAKAQLDAGDSAGARITIDSAFARSLPMPNEIEPRWVKRRSKLGEETSEAVGWWDKATMLGAIGAVQARLGDFESARRSLAAIGQVPWRGPGPRVTGEADLLDAAALARAERGDLAGALRTADEIAELWQRDQTIARLAKLQLGRGDIAGARRTVAAIKSPGVSTEDSRGEVLGLIAVAEARAGNDKAAFQTLALSAGEVGANRFERLGDIAQVQAQRGDSIAAYTTLALAQREAAHVPQRSGLGSTPRGYALSDIARAWARIGRPDSALALARDPDWQPWQPSAYIDAAEALALAGDTAAAVLTLREGSRNAAGGRFSILLEQAAIGDTAGAASTLRGFISNDAKGSATLALANAYARAGNLDAARRSANEYLRDHAGGHGIFQTLGKALVHPLGGTLAQSWALSQGSPRSRARALLGVAEGLAESLTIPRQHRSSVERQR